MIGGGFKIANSLSRLAESLMGTLSTQASLYNGSCGFVLLKRKLSRYC
jgi:hypothetical protein